MADYPLTGAQDPNLAPVTQITNYYKDIVTIIRIIITITMIIIIYTALIITTVSEVIPSRPTSRRSDMSTSRASARELSPFMGSSQEGLQNMYAQSTYKELSY